MHKCFVSEKPVLGKNFLLEGEEALHIIKSLRMREGEQILLCDGKCNDFLCEISEFTKSTVAVTPLQKSISTAEPNLAVTLYQCIPKGDKMETIIQKSVELGVFSVIPVLSSRCISKPDKKSAISKNTRYNQIALEAAKQSNRGIVPSVALQISFNELVRILSRHEQTFLLYEGETENSFAKQNFKGGDIAFIVGPEGGFSKDEALSLAKSGAISCSLGSRILRTETAGLCALSVIMAKTDNM